MDKKAYTAPTLTRFGSAVARTLGTFGKTAELLNFRILP
jgi:hypothetical protein